MNQTTATTIVNNKIGEIVLTRFKGLPVCYADNVEEYRYIYSYYRTAK